MSVIDGDKFCTGCNKKTAKIWMIGYAENADIFLCAVCAIQLVRKIMEDLCDMAGDRHG